MKLEINLDETYVWETYGWSDESVADIIKDEIREEIRRAIKRHLKDKNAELAKAVQAFANAQAEVVKKQIEEKMIGSIDLK